MSVPKPEDEHYAYVQDIADRLGLPPHVVEPVFRETLHTLAAGAVIETFVVLLAAASLAASNCLLPTTACLPYNLPKLS
ncbi:hypothetical protein ACI2VK_10275 [Ralstonia nicotianae]|nr:hypothetical protein [Ralstonia solanacearum]